MWWAVLLPKWMLLRECDSVKRLAKRTHTIILHAVISPTPSQITNFRVVRQFVLADRAIKHELIMRVNFHFIKTDSVITSVAHSFSRFRFSSVCSFAISSFTIRCIRARCALVNRPPFGILNRSVNDSAGINSHSREPSCPSRNIVITAIQSFWSRSARYLPTNPRSRCDNAASPPNARHNSPLPINSSKLRSLCDNLRRPARPNSAANHSGKSASSSRSISNSDISGQIV